MTTKKRTASRKPELAPASVERFAATLVDELTDALEAVDRLSRGRITKARYHKAVLLYRDLDRTKYIAEGLRTLAAQARGPEADKRPVER